MVDSNRRFKKRFLAVLEKSHTAGVFHTLSATGSSPEFVTQHDEYTPVLVHTVGFYPPLSKNS